MAAARKLATYTDLLALPAEVTGQIVAGELHVHPRPNYRHARVSSRLGSALDGPFDVARRTTEHVEVGP